MQKHVKYVNLYLQVIEELKNKNRLANILTKIYRKRFALRVYSSLKIQTQIRRYFALKKVRKIIAKNLLNEIITKVKIDKKEREEKEKSFK